MATYTGLLTLPTDPTPAVKVLIDKLRGVEVPHRTLAHAAVHLQAFTVQQFQDTPGGPVASFAPKGHSCTEKDLEAHLVAFDGGLRGLEEVPWELILTSVLRLVELWLKK